MEKKRLGGVVQKDLSCRRFGWWRVVYLHAKVKKRKMNVQIIEGKNGGRGHREHDDKDREPVKE